MQANREIFKAISGYDNYEISSFGRVRNVRTGRILKNNIDTRGYYKVNLCMTTLNIHRLVCEAFNENPNNLKFVDHIDGDRKNNHYENLRFCSMGQNAMNRTKSINCSSAYKGVTWNKRLQKWHSRIKINRKHIHLGFFEDEIEAARKYNEKAIELFKEFAKLNELPD